jgi:hypothetical protein
MKSRTWVGCLAGVALGFALSSLSPPQLIGQDKAKEPEMKPVKWEYSVKTRGDEKTLNEYGDEGWELVCHDPGASFFKRPKR